MLWQRAIGMICLLLAATSLPVPARASEPNRAGLVVQFGDGRVQTYCVAFQEDEIWGADLLTYSGLQVRMGTSGSLGIIVCRIEDQGCNVPLEPCFCQCSGNGECVYWNYFYLDPGEVQWTYSPLGAGLRKVQPGSVEAWVWGNGRTLPANEWTFETICLPATPMPTATALPPMPTDTAVPPTPLAATVTAAPIKTCSPVPSLVVSATATFLPPSPAPVSSLDTGATWSNYWPFALVVLGLVVVGSIAWLRRA